MTDIVRIVIEVDVEDAEIGHKTIEETALEAAIQPDDPGIRVVDVELLCEA